MAIILNIETSSKVCSVCLAGDGNILEHIAGSGGNEHAGKLTVFIDEIMRKAQLSYAMLDAVAVSSGPGSYTGLRIGTSVAKGLCYALNIPLIAVPTLMALAENVKLNTRNMPAVFMPVMDAGRMDIYTALYDFQGNEFRPAAMITINEELVASLSAFASVAVGGNAAQKLKEAITGKHFQFVENIVCDARSMPAISEKKYRTKCFEDTAYFQPFYLQEFEPKRKMEGGKLLN